jgi:hypothetical protein
MKQSAWMSYEDVFKKWLKLSKKLVSNTWDEIDLWWDFKKNIESILDIRAQYTKTDEYTSLIEKLRQDFYVDGAIKVDRNQLINELIQWFLYWNIDMSIILENLKKITYDKWNDMVFRSPEYYFLFEWIDISWIDGGTSINDFLINSINIEEFLDNLNVHLTGIFKTLNIFWELVQDLSFIEMKKNRLEMKNNLDKILPEQTLIQFSNVLKLDDNDYPTDFYSKELFGELVSKLERYRNLICIFDQVPSKINFDNLMNFIWSEKRILQEISNIFWIDIIWVIDNNFDIKLPTEIRKVILWLIDAKVNIYAFMQNIEQILASDNFLNSEFEWKLIFNKDQTRNIKKISPKLFNEFKKLQEKLKCTDELWNKWAYIYEKVNSFVEILMWKWDLWLFIETSSVYDKNNMWDYSYWGDIDNIKMFWPSQELTIKFFNLLDDYIEEVDWVIEKRKKKYIKKKWSTEWFTIPDQHNKLKKSAINKLIRLYREENDPLVIISTIQNAYHYIVSQWYDHEKYDLYFMWVNYWWTMIGHFAKSVFNKILDQKQWMNETWNIIYSIYDVRNADNFSSLIDYPSVNVTLEEKETDIRDKWMLIFDDNTHSWETLHNLTELSEKSWMYDRVDSFPCRVWIDLAKYSKKVSDQEKLRLLSVAWVEARSANIIKNKERYKEIVWTIIGKRVYKELKK